MLVLYYISIILACISCLIGELIGSRILQTNIGWFSYTTDCVFQIGDNLVKVSLGSFAQYLKL